MEMRMMMNIDSLECCMCEGIFATGEKVIEDGEDLYCEACYETESDTGEIY
jgi:hypothetical protein